MKLSMKSKIATGLLVVASTLIITSNANANATGTQRDYCYGPSSTITECSAVSLDKCALAAVQVPSTTGAAPAWQPCDLQGNAPNQTCGATSSANGICTAVINAIPSNKPSKPAKP